MITIKNDRVSQGFEHGVHYFIDSTHFDPIVIICFTENGEYESCVHNCMYKPIFGYDIADRNEVEKILDRLIAKYANDGYNSKFESEVWNGKND